MIRKQYEFLTTSEDPTFDLKSANLAGGNHAIVVAAEDDAGMSEYSREAVYTQEWNEYVIEKPTLTAIADSVRAKTGKADVILAKDLASEIDKIMVYEEPKLELLTVNKQTLEERTVYDSQYDKYTYRPGDGYDGISEAVVELETDCILDSNGFYSPATAAGFRNVIVRVEPDLYDATFNNNGTYTKENLPSDYYGYGSVTVNVQPKLQEKTADSNKVVIPDSGYDGLSKVTVNVQPKLQEKTAESNEVVTPDSDYDGLSKVTVNVQPKLQEKTAESNEVVTPDSGYDGLSKVTVKISLEEEAISGSLKFKDSLDLTGMKGSYYIPVELPGYAPAQGLQFVDDGNDHYLQFILPTPEGYNGVDKTYGNNGWGYRPDTFKLQDGAKIPTKLYDWLWKNAERA